MTCDEYRKWVTEGYLRPDEEYEKAEAEIVQHLEECSECEKFLGQKEVKTAWLDELLRKIGRMHRIEKHLFN